MKPASDDTPPKQGLGSSHHGKHDGGEVIKVGVENDKGGRFSCLVSLRHKRGVSVYPKRILKKILLVIFLYSLAIL